MAKKQETAPDGAEEAVVTDASGDPVAEPVAVRGAAIRVRVTRTYIGFRSGENAIEPGVYAEDDPLLFNMASYLLENGYAERYV